MMIFHFLKTKQGGSNNLSASEMSDRAMRNSLTRHMDLREKYAINGVVNNDDEELIAGGRKGSRKKKSFKTRKQLFSFLFKKTGGANGDNAGGGEDDGGRFHDIRLFRAASFAPSTSEDAIKLVLPQGGKSLRRRGCYLM